MTWNVSGTWNGASINVLGSELPTIGLHGASILIEAGLVDPVAEANDQFNVTLVTLPQGTQLTEFNNDGTFIWPGNTGEYRSFTVGWSKNNVPQANVDVFVGVSPEIPHISNSSQVFALSTIQAPLANLNHIASTSQVHALIAMVGESTQLPFIASTSTVYSLGFQIETMVQLEHIGSVSAVYGLTYTGGGVPEIPKRGYGRMYTSMRSSMLKDSKPL